MWRWCAEGCACMRACASSLRQDACVTAARRMRRGGTVRVRVEIERERVTGDSTREIKLGCVRGRYNGGAHTCFAAIRLMAGGICLMRWPSSTVRACMKAASCDPLGISPAATFASMKSAFDSNSSWNCVSFLARAIVSRCRGVPRRDGREV